MNSTATSSEVEINKTIRFAKALGITLSLVFPMVFLGINLVFNPSDDASSSSAKQTATQSPPILTEQLISRDHQSGLINNVSASISSPSAFSNRSVAPPVVDTLFRDTGFAGLIGVLLGLLSYLFIVKVPVEGMRRVNLQVQETQRRLDMERSEKERALRQIEFSGQAMKHLASHDLLTDLPNRSFLEASLREAINTVESEGGFFTLIVMDLNRFKDINDNLGHHSGDLVIREVARRLKRIAPSPSTVARLDGDEFAILNTTTRNAEDATSFCHQVLETLEVPLALQGYSLDTSASLGVVFFPNHGSNADMLIQHANIAMHLAKSQSKEFVVFEDSMNKEELNNLSLRGDLRSAIEQGALQVHYQPKINLHSGRIFGVEALARWVHPLRGAVSPALFIPIAEQTGLIHPLTGLVFNISLNQAAEWRTQNREFGIAINLSVRSLHDPHLPERVRVMLETWNIPSKLITLEITESAIMADPNRALNVLAQLSEMGIQVSIDDYGTGYSSLSYLKRLPVQEIKIDRSFVRDMVRNENDKVIVRATIDMAHDLGLKVTAEGVEDKDTWDTLLDFDCDNAQGFYMGRPQTAEDLSNWLNKSPWTDPAKYSN